MGAICLTTTSENTIMSLKRTEIQIHNDSLGDTKWGQELIHHTNGHVILHDWFKDDDPEDESTSIVIYMSDVPRLIAGLKAIQILDEVE